MKIEGFKRESSSRLSSARSKASEMGKRRERGGQTRAGHGGPLNDVISEKISD